VQPAAAAARGAPAHTPQVLVGAVPPGGDYAVPAMGLRVGVAVEVARARETGVGGAGGGHHGVRKGTHGSVVGVAPNSLEVFGEKHTKG
jgi:hypothetical protein